MVTGGVAADTFYVDSADGKVILRRPVSAGDSYTFVIEAKDGGSPPLSATIYVTVNVLASDGGISFGKFRND